MKKAKLSPGKKAAKTTKARRAARKAADTRKMNGLLRRAKKALDTMKGVQAEIESMLKVLE